MKIILTNAEVKTIVLDYVNQTFVASFNEVTFDGYSPFKTATLETVEALTSEEVAE